MRTLHKFALLALVPVPIPFLIFEPATAMFCAVCLVSISIILAGIQRYIDFFMGRDRRGPWPLQ